jgi:predicted metal-dependent phosphoesterase TrpH
MAVDAGLRVIAITDHDSVEGVTPALVAAQDFPSIIVIPGVEMSTDVPHGEVHLLGYFIDYTDPLLAETLERLRNARRVRAQGMVAKLANLGIQVDWERVQELAGSGSLGRPHIAQAMFEKGYVHSIKEAFLKYIGRDGPAYVEREKMTPSQAVELVVKTGGLPVLAHPADIENLEELIPELQKAGLAGIEAYYNGYTTKTVSHLVSLAHEYGLIVCGGSDYHGFMDNSETLLGGIEIPYECVEQLLALAGQRTAMTTQ